MGSVSRKKGSAKPTPSPADEADQRALERAVQAMIEHPLTGWDHTRPLGSLNRDDLKKIAMSAITGWIREKAEQACNEGTDPNEAVLSAEFATPN